MDEAGFWKPLVNALKVSHAACCKPRSPDLERDHATEYSLFTMIPLQIMMPIVEILRLMDGEMPAMGKVYQGMFMIQNKIDESMLCLVEGRGCQDSRGSLGIFALADMHAAGYVLEFMEMQDDMDKSTQNGLMNVIENICLRDEIGKAADPAALIHKLGADGIDSKEEALMKKVADRVAKTELELATYQQREGIFTKANGITNAKVMALAKWWSMYCKHLPLLSAVARSVLCQPVCALAAERNWSVYGQIKTTTRSRMGHTVSDKRVYCHEALRMTEKLTKAGYTQRVEKWDSDSDSDSSDEEDQAV